MARLIRHTATGPIKIDPKDFPPDNKPIWICACGLTRTPPYCDKSHKQCVAEQPGTLYVYDESRATVTQTLPDPGT
jgi:CDGSH-type Zn-finger protein